MSKGLNKYLEFPSKKRQLVLLSCCAPCSCEVMERLANNNIKTTILFYNPNIFPEQEYNKRLRENRKVAMKYGFPFIDLDWESEKWLNETKGLENEPEQGARCSKCFVIRLRKTFEYAKANGFEVVSSTLATSRWKNLSQVNEIGNSISKDFGIFYWDINWKKDGGQDRQRELVKELDLYNQDYCGCPFSQKSKKILSKVESTTQEGDKLTPLSKKEIFDIFE